MPDGGTVGTPVSETVVLADARFSTAMRIEGTTPRTGIRAWLQVARLAWCSDAFAAQVLYRAKARLQDSGVPILPRLAHHLAMMLSQVSIGDPVVIQPGLYLPHGQVVIDGFVEIGPNVVIGPWVTIGLVAGNVHGPAIEANARVGTGASVLGPLTVGRGAVIGANAVVVRDVEAGTTVVGSQRTVPSR